MTAMTAAPVVATPPAGLCAETPEVTLPRMDPGQEDGSQCVVCWRENPEVPVGRTRTGETGRACADPCARQLGFRGRP
jgi:hypothetical protein